MSIESLMPSNHLILCRPLLPSPSVFPSIRVLSNESAVCIRWPNYWNFSFSISPYNEYSGLISNTTLHKTLQHNSTKFFITGSPYRGRSSGQKKFTSERVSFFYSGLQQIESGPHTLEKTICFTQFMDLNVNQRYKKKIHQIPVGNLAYYLSTAPHCKALQWAKQTSKQNIISYRPFPRKK